MLSDIPPPAVVDFKHAAQGGTFERTFFIEEAEGVACNITGWSTARMQIRATRQPDASLVAELTTGNGRIVIVDATLGKIKIILPSDVTALIQGGTYEHDFELIQDATNPPRVWRVFMGRFTFSNEVTR